jgi:hypothetical protein
LFFRIELRGANLRPTYQPVFITRTGDTDTILQVPPLNGSSTADDDSIAAFFSERDLAGFQHAAVDNLLAGIRNGATILMPAQSLPIGVVDQETGQLVSAPPVRHWPGHFLPRGGRPDWSGERNDAFIPPGTGLDDEFDDPTKPGPFDGGDPFVPFARSGAGRSTRTSGVPDSVPVPRDSTADDASSASAGGGAERVTASTAVRERSDRRRSRQRDAEAAAQRRSEAARRGAETRRANAARARRERDANGDGSGTTTDGNE